MKRNSIVNHLEDKKRVLVYPNACAKGESGHESAFCAVLCQIRYGFFRTL